MFLSSCLQLLHSYFDFFFHQSSLKILARTKAMTAFFASTDKKNNFENNL